MIQRLVVDLSTGTQQMVTVSAQEEAAIVAASNAYAATMAPILAQIAADEQARIDAKAEPVIQYLRDHTPAECAAYVAANVTNLATATNVLQKMAMALSVLAKKEFR